MSPRCPNRVALMAAAVRPPVNPGAAKKAVTPGFRWRPGSIVRRSDQRAVLARMHSRYAAR
jgi:hypothetical protein